MKNRILIVGAGPAGLSIARSLAATPATITIVEKQAEADLVDPSPDGREIALTHRSIKILRDFGVWPRIPADEIFPLREAHVRNGRSPVALVFDPGRNSTNRLGSLVSNHIIRRALYEAVAEQGNIDWRTGHSIVAASAGRDAAMVQLDNGEQLDADLLIAADSRFSYMRDQVGIGARKNRIGKSMIVCRIEHDRDHGHVATEWFDHGQTLALLPLGPFQSSAVLTLVDGQARQLAALPPDALNGELTRRFRVRCGTVRTITRPHVYPLTTTYADRFVGDRVALAGDAAVGMHPVTAHGFNLGLSGSDRIGRLLAQVMARGGDAGDQATLRHYERGHRAATFPLYQATNAIAGLFTDERALARVARNVAIGVGARLPFARHAVSSMLMQRG